MQHGSMRRFLLILVIGLTTVLAAAAQDLSVSIKQSVADKFFGDATYPVKVVDVTHPFAPPLSSYSTQGAQPITLFTHPADVSDLNVQIQAYKNTLLGKLDRAIKDYQYATANGVPWGGPTIGEMQNLQAALKSNAVIAARGDFDVAVNVASLKVFVTSRPSVTLGAPSTGLSNVNVNVDANAELWVKSPYLDCTDSCSIGPISFCCKYEWKTKWDKILTVPFNLNFIAQANLTLFQNQREVDGKIAFSSLHLNDPILGFIELKDLANANLAQNAFTVLKLDDLAAALPYVNNTYVVDQVTLSGAGEIRLDMTVTKK